MRKLGLIGGLGAGATIEYYRELSGRGCGEMLMIHADMQYALKFVQRGDRLGLAEYFAGLIDRLRAGGADIAAISAVTPHICIRELEAISSLPLVSIVNVIRGEILRRGYTRVALFGTRFVVESKMFGMLDGVDVLVPDQTDAIHTAYMRTVEGGTEGRAVLTQIAKELPVDAVVLAGTDLALIFNETNTEFPHIDALKVHVDAILTALHNDATS